MLAGSRVGQEWFGNALSLPHVFSVQSLFGFEVGKAHDIACCQMGPVHRHCKEALDRSSLPQVSDCRTRKYVRLSSDRVPET